jgi:hypothetical protein
MSATIILLGNMDMNVDGVDSVVRAVLEKFVMRSRFGRAKYGTDLDRTDLSASDWITHAQEELMDGILYLEKLRASLSPPQAAGLTNHEPLPPTKIDEDDAPHTFTT